MEFILSFDVRILHRGHAASAHFCFRLSRNFRVKRIISRLRQAKEMLRKMFKLMTGR
jgi:hypothetical protein